MESRLLLAGDFGFALSIGASQNDRAAAVEVDGAGNVLVAGHFKETVDFDPSSAVQSRKSAGDYDLYVAKYTPTGSLLWVKSMGGSGWDETMAMAVDASGDVFLTGYFYSTADFDPGSGVKSLKSKGGADGYVVKLDADGNFKWVAQFAGSSDSGGTSIAIDDDGAAYVGGMYSSSVDLNPGADEKSVSSKGSHDDFVVKLSSSGGYVFGKHFGGSGDDYLNGIALDGQGHVHVAGSFFNSVDFDPNSGETKLKSAGGSDVYLSELTSTGGFVSAKRLGGSGSDLAGDVTADEGGNVYVTGGFKGKVDFDPGSGTANRTSAGDLDAFVLKLNAAASFAWVYTAGSSSLDRGTDLTLGGDGSIYYTGQFAGTVDFGSNVLSSSNGTSDILIGKLNSSGSSAWARRAGGSGTDDTGEGVATDDHGNVFSVGSFTGSGDFNPGSGSFTLASRGAVDAFLLALLA